MDNNIQLHQKELCNKLWTMANALRGNMEAYEFKNYILGMIFYYYLSDRTEKYMDNLLKDDNITYENAWENEEYKEAVIEESLRDLGYVIEPQYLFCKLVEMVENRSFDIEFLQSAINSLMESTIGNESQDDFEGLFSDMALDSTKLGHSVKDRSVVMAKIIAALDEINFSMEDTKIDVLGNAYEYLIGQFAATAGKKAGEFYTPAGPAELLCRLACLGLTDVKAAADPTCGSGSLLLRLKKYANVRLYYGQELTSTTYNLARMNMILRGIPYRHFHIYNGDTLENDYFGDMKFRVQVANPPYSANWSADMKFMEDERFNEYGKLAPKSKADFAFVQHMVHHMDEDGRAVVLLPHGVLFRGAAEETIRKYLIEKLNVLDAVIGLPANLFFGTGIPVCVLVLKRERNGNSDNILFIDASREYEAGKNQNILRESDIDKIVETYEKRMDVDKYAHVATMDEIKENGFNLNIPRYVDTFEPEPEIDLNEVAAEIRKLQAEIKSIDAELKPYFDELGLDFPFDVEV
ncbi:MAG: type I restriction-modification system subunit M [Lachnospira sp.]